MISDEWFASLRQPLDELTRRGLEYLPSVVGAVLLLVIGKRYDGKPKVKRIACPDKGSNIR